MGDKGTQHFTSRVDGDTLGYTAGHSGENGTQRERGVGFQGTRWDTARWDTLGHIGTRWDTKSGTIFLCGNARKNPKN